MISYELGPDGAVKPIDRVQTEPEWKISLDTQDPILDNLRREKIERAKLFQKVIALDRSGSLLQSPGSEKGEQ